MSKFTRGLLIKPKLDNPIAPTLTYVGLDGRNNILDTQDYDVSAVFISALQHSPDRGFSVMERVQVINDIVFFSKWVDDRKKDLTILEITGSFIVDRKIDGKWKRGCVANGLFWRCSGANKNWEGPWVSKRRGSTDDKVRTE